MGEEQDAAHTDAIMLANMVLACTATVAMGEVWLRLVAVLITRVCTSDRRCRMSFHGYLTTITAKTGKRPDDFRQLAEHMGFTEDGTINAGVKAGDIVQWLKHDVQLGHGHAMAIDALLTGAKSEASDERARRMSSRGAAAG